MKPNEIKPATYAYRESRFDEKLDLLLQGVDAVRSECAAFHSRMDAFEKKRKEKK